MTPTRPSPVVRLYNDNPWSYGLPDGVLLGILTTAAVEVEESLRAMLSRGEAGLTDGSLAVALVNPTRPRDVSNFADLVLATIEFGSYGGKHTPYALAMADAHHRHGEPNGELIRKASHRLGNEDAAYGGSVEFNGMIGAGDGLSVLRNIELTKVILVIVVDRVRGHIDNWLYGRRQATGQHGFYNPEGTPGATYDLLLRRVPYRRTGE